ncbi:hypothetical protein [Salinimicrobium marinum]|nr:hypothetical protein [Salinimicrobium marinum]
MEERFEINLLHSRIVIGSHSNMNKNLSCVESLELWLHHKDLDWGMEDFRSKETLYVSYLHIVELPLLKLIIEDLISTYRKYFPYAEKEDFVSYVFGFTLYDLERFLSRDYRWLGSPPNNSKYEYYYCEDDHGSGYIDFAIPENSSIEHYRQYYKQVISLINEISYDSTRTASPALLNNKKSKEYLNDNGQKEREEIRASKAYKNGFSILQWATIFYYAEDSGLLPKDNTKENQMQQFISEHPFHTTMNSFKNKYSMAKKQINRTHDYPLKKLELLIPYLEKNYPKTIGRVQNDLTFLKEEKEKMDK